MKQWSYCPYCSGDLDTGWECNDCGADWMPIERLQAVVKSQGETIGMAHAHAAMATAHVGRMMWGGLAVGLIIGWLLF